MSYDAERTQSLLELRRWADAEACARSALATDPSDPQALLDLARALAPQGRRPEALAAARAALTSAPGEPPILKVLTDLHIDADNRPAALVTADALVRAAPLWWVSHYAMARALMMDPVDTEPALESADKAVELAPDEADAHNLRGILLGERGRTREARAAYEAALRCDPQHAPALNNLGVLGLRGRDLRSAAQGLGRAVATDPHHRLAHDNLGALVLQLSHRCVLRLFLWSFLVCCVALAESSAPVRAVLGLLGLAGIVGSAARDLRAMRLPTKDVVGDTWARLAGEHRVALATVLLAAVVLLVVSVAPATMLLPAAPWIGLACLFGAWRYWELSRRVDRSGL